jgi:peptide/nickel transport system substrate-binding protein
MRTQQLVKLITLFSICFALVVGCNSNQTVQVSPNKSTENGRISIGTTLKARTVDPADSYELAGLNVIYNVCESLYTYELGTTKIKPLLATEMPKISADGLTYSITLRQGVTFHDGSPFNAKAMALSLKRFMENGGKPSFLLTDTIESVQEKGDTEIKIKLKQPFAAFPSLLAFPGTCAVSPQSYKIGAGQFNPNQLIGTGPYQLIDFSSEGLKLDVNEKYWGEKPLNKGVDMQIYPGNSANLFNSFRTRAIKVAYQSLDPDQIKTLKEEGEKGELQVIEAPGTAVSYMVLNLNQEPLNKPEVRQAIASLIDRNLLNERIFQGQTEPIYSLIPTAFDSYKPVFKDNYGNANFTKAKELLEKAGYSAQNPAIIQIWHPSGSITRGILAATLKALAEKELGGLIKFEPNSVESASFFDNLSKGVYPAALADWYPDFLDADNYLQPFLDCTKGSEAKGCEEGAAQSRGSFYYSQQANDLIKQEREEQKPETRQKIFAQLQDILGKDVPYVPLWQSKDYAFAHKDITGVTINPSQNFPFWTIKLIDN